MRYVKKKGGGILTLNIISLDEHERVLERYIANQRLLRGMLIYFSIEVVAALVFLPILMPSFSRLSTPVPFAPTDIAILVLTPIAVWLTVFFTFRYLLNAYVRFSETEFELNRRLLFTVAAIPFIPPILEIVGGPPEISWLNIESPAPNFKAEYITENTAFLASFCLVVALTAYVMADYCRGLLILLRSGRLTRLLLSFGESFPKNWLRQPDRKVTDHCNNTIRAIKHLYGVPETLALIKGGKPLLLACFVFMAVVETMATYDFWGAIQQWIGVATNIIDTCNPNDLLHLNTRAMSLELCRLDGLPVAFFGYCNALASNSREVCLEAASYSMFFGLYAFFIPMTLVSCGFLFKKVRQFAVGRLYIKYEQESTSDISNVEKILFLRPFNKKQILLRGSPWTAGNLIGKLLNLGRGPATLDNMLLEENFINSGKNKGRRLVISVYDRNELTEGEFKERSFSVLRIELDQIYWRDRVTGLATDDLTTAIVCYAGEIGSINGKPTGIEQEIFEIVAPNEKKCNKTLFLFDPDPKIRETTTRRFIRDVIARGSSAQDLVPIDSLLAAFTRDGTHWQLLASSTFSENAHLLALRYYFRRIEVVDA